MAAVDFPSSPSVGQEVLIGGVVYVWNGTGWIVKTQGTVVVASAGPVGPPQGRLTLSAGSPVVVPPGITAASVLSYMPYVGQRIPISDGVNMVMKVVPEVGISTSVGDVGWNPVAVGPSEMHDWFVWDNGGTLRLTHGLKWTSDTSRGAVGVTRSGGIWVNNEPIVNGPVAGMGTYVGTTRSGTDARLYFQYGGMDREGRFWVWNAYNRAQIVSESWLSVVLWQYTGNVYRSSNGQDLVAHHFVSGLREDGIVCSHSQTVATIGGGTCQIGTGLDTFGSLLTPGYNTVGGNGQNLVMSNVVAPQLGAHFIGAVENGNGVSAASFWGGGNHRFYITLRA